jgi:hypothetical protein
VEKCVCVGGGERWGGAVVVCRAMVRWGGEAGGGDMRRRGRGGGGQCKKCKKMEMSAVGSAVGEASECVDASA